MPSSFWPKLTTMTARLMLLGVGLLLTGALLRVHFLGNYLRQEVTDMTLTQVLTLADFVAKEVEHRMSERRDFVMVLSSALPVSMLSRRPLLQAWLAERQELNPLFSQGLVVLNLHGEVLADYPAEGVHLGPEVLQSDYFRAAAQGLASTGCPFKADASALPALPMAAPLHNAAGQVQAVVVGVTWLHSPEFLGTLSRTRVGDGGGLMLVSTGCKMLVGASDIDLALQPTPAPGESTLHDQAMKGFRGVGTELRHGVEELVGISSVAGTDWFVLARIPTSELFESVARLRVFMLKSTTLMVLCFLLLGYFLLRHQLGPLNRAAKQADAMVGGERPLQPLKVERHDEVGLLTAAFNRLLGKLMTSHAELDHLAHYDALTGLPNRQLLADRMQQAFARAQRTGEQLVVLFLDLDGFKPVNDAFGHDGGDVALREVAARLQAVVRAGDTVARMGGDEFIILLPDLRDSARDTAQRVAQKCQQVFAQPFVICGQRCALGVSIGIACSAGNGDPDKLLIAADQAMYQAKKAGPGRVQWAA